MGTKVEYELYATKRTNFAQINIGDFFKLVDAGDYTEAVFLKTNGSGKTNNCVYIYPEDTRGTLASINNERSVQLVDNVCIGFDI